MTASLIDPQAIATIKARRPASSPVPAEDAPATRTGKTLITPQRIARMTPQDWRRGFEQTVTLLTTHLAEARKREDGTEIAAYLLEHGLDVFAHGIALFNGGHADPRRELREVVEETLGVVWDATKRSIQAGVELYHADLHAQLTEQLSAERDQMTAAADSAGREASEARRALDAARREHADALARKEAELERLAAQLRQERAATIERDRNHRNELHQVRNDLANARTTIAHLNAECERLERDLDDATAPQEPAMTLTPNPLLAAHSLAAYLIAEGHPARVVGHEVRLPDGAALPAGLCQRWGAAYPTDAARLAHLRGVVRGTLGRVAAWS